VDPKVVTKIIEKIENKFGKMTVTRGKEQVFLGMKITYNDDGTATINMKEYLKEAIVGFGKDIVKLAATPAKRDLFDIKEDSRYFLLRNERRSTEL
jgi:hypothetical protein